MLTGPVHKVTDTWETYRNVLRSKANKDLATSNPADLGTITYGTGLEAAVNGIGQRTSATRTGGGYAATNTEAWDYNANGEVIDADHNDNNKDRAYTFDSIGNRLAASQGAAGAAPTAVAYTPDALNQYDTINPGTALNPIHDLDGNLADDGSLLLFTWDAENRLVAVHERDTTTDPPNVIEGALIAEYAYDYMSRRVWKKVHSAASGGTVAETLFHYEGWNLCAEYPATSLKTIATTTAPARTYTWGPDLSGSLQGAGGVGGLLAIEEKLVTSPVNHKGVYYPLYDGNGNVTQLVRDDGSGGATLVAHYEYDPFGNLSNTAAQQNVDGTGYYAINPFKFSTKYHDQESGFYYYGYRYSDPVTGRWPSRDPIGERGGVNLYGFVGNDGVNNWDELGQFYTPPTKLPPPPTVWPPAVSSPGPVACNAMIAAGWAAIAQVNLQMAPSWPYAVPSHESMPFQHCVWNCRMTIGLGETAAKFFSRLKEEKDTLAALLAIRLIAAGCWPSTPEAVKDKLRSGGRSAHQPADYADNETGRECGKECGGFGLPGLRDAISRAFECCECCCYSSGVSSDAEEGPGTDRPFGPFTPWIPGADIKPTPPTKPWTP